MTILKISNSRFKCFYYRDMASYSWQTQDIKYNIMPRPTWGYMSPESETVSEAVATLEITF